MEVILGLAVILAVAYIRLQKQQHEYEHDEIKRHLKNLEGVEMEEYTKSLVRRYIKNDESE
jgi:hypothetical protein